MNVFGIFIIYGWVFPCVFLASFLSRRQTQSGDKAEKIEPSVFENIIYHGCKWLTIFWLFFWVLFYLPASWPPHWLERMQQRKIVIQRVQQAGGWDVIKRDCNGLVQSNATTGFQWFNNWNDTNNLLLALPESLAKLKPHSVDLSPEADGMQSIRIQIFGGHATGGRGVDFYTIKVVCPLPPNVKSPFKFDPDAKVQYGDRKIVDGVYEVTRHG